MEKLELKHLAPYFPYSLKGKCIYDDSDEIEYLQGIDISKSRPISTTHDDWYFNEWKRILRPLSDLTKDEYICLFIGNLLDYKIDELSYKVFVKLLELHFDVFHLIPQGLAIDINTLK